MVINLKSVLPFIISDLVYYKLNDRDQALKYYQEALNLKNEIDNKYDLDILLVNIGLCYAYNKRFSEASKYIGEGFAKCGKDCSDNLLLHGSLGYGIIFFYEKEFSKAEQQFLKSYALSKKVTPRASPIGKHNMVIGNLYSQ